MKYIILLTRLLPSIIVTLFFFGSTLVMSGTASASAAQTDACSGLSQLNSGAQEQCGGGNGTSTVSALVKTIITILSFIVGAASVIVIIISGLRYITSGGESSKVSGAKSGLVYALIGIAIAVLAQVIAHYALSAANSSIK